LLYGAAGILPETIEEADMELGILIESPPLGQRIGLESGGKTAALQNSVHHFFYHFV
jgi:hypothetical protein